MKSFIAAGVMIVGALVLNQAHAQPLPKPTGKVLLTVTGNITNTNVDDKTAQFDRDMLLSLEEVSHNTITPWSEGKDLYRGPLLRSVMSAVGAKGNTLSITALNDYSASVPVKDGDDYDVILAIDLNDQPMSVRNKGPVFLLYPFSQHPSLNNEVIHNRSVWQIKSISVE